MTEKKNYPEEIYCKDYVIGEMLAAERAYDLGLRDGAKQSDPLAGFSNLTQAIHNGSRIGWERLDGRAAKCVHPDMGTLTHKMERFKDDTPSHYLGWVSTSSVWNMAFDLAWQGKSGWSLWVEGELPVKPRTADELEPGSVFIGNSPKSTASQMFVAAHHSNPGDPDLVAYRVDNPVTSWQWAECVEVIEVKSGGFTSPKEEA